MIKPSVGRVVWYHPIVKHTQPYAAIVVYVNDDDNVNLTVFDDEGHQFGLTNVILYQNEPNQEKPENNFCEWMPYQQGQAAKTEELEKKLQQK